MQTLQTWKINSTGLEPVFNAETADTMDAVTTHLPEGGYTTFRTFGKIKALHLADHIRRLEETARLTNAPARISAQQIRQGLRQALSHFSAPEARARIVVDFVQHPGEVYLILEPLQAPAPDQYLYGVRLVSRVMHRENARAKQTSFLQTAQTVRESLPAGIYETLMIAEDGEILEGLTSNFFAVVDNTIWTAEKDVLAGITRTLVLNEADRAQIPIRFRGLPIDRIGEMQEAFITSSSRGVLGVIEIDGQRIGSGEPGKITRLLAERYTARLERELETI